MPLPRPKTSENQEDFMDRCLANPTVNTDFPDNKQRYAVCMAQWDRKDDRSAISFNSAHPSKPATTEDAWDGPANETRLRTDGNASYYKKAFAYVDSDGDPDVKSSYRFIHHMVSTDGTIGAANMRACSSGIAVLNGGRGGTTIPADAVQGVYNHLAQHLRDGEKEPPALQRSLISLPFKKGKPERRLMPNMPFQLLDPEGPDDELEPEPHHPKIYGYAALFDSVSEDLGGYREILYAGCFKKTLQEADVRALVNHDPNYVLGRNKSGTLQLWEDGRGLRMEINPPDTQWAKDLITSIQRGDITQCSFGFRTIEDDFFENETGDIIRQIRQVELFDVSIVTYPAYVNTSVSVRSLLHKDEFRTFADYLDTYKIDLESARTIIEKTRNNTQDSIVTRPDHLIHPETITNIKSLEPSFDATLAEQRKREIQILQMCIQMEG